MRSHVDAWRRLWEKVRQEVFPDRYSCIVCHCELPQPHRLGVCEACGKTLPLVGSAHCLKCGKPFLPAGSDAPLAPREEEWPYVEGEHEESSVLSGYCAMCRHSSREFDWVRSVFSYQGEARHLVCRLKYGNERWLAPYLAAYLVDVFCQNLQEVDLVVPVPLHRLRARQRGYNQSHLLARQVAERLHLSYSTTALVKVRATAMQSALNGKERQENLHGAFDCDAEAVRGKRVLVIDDVLTTGATMSEVARTLKKKGAVHVYGLTVANVPER